MVVGMLVVCVRERSRAPVGEKRGGGGGGGCKKRERRGSVVAFEKAHTRSAPSLTSRPNVFSPDCISLGSDEHRSFPTT